MREFPSGPVVRTLGFHCQGPGVQSLVGELRSHKPRGEAKKKKKRANNIHLFSAFPSQPAQCLWNELSSGAEKRLLCPYNPVWHWIISINWKKMTQWEAKKDVFYEVTTPQGMILSSNTSSNAQWDSDLRRTFLGKILRDGVKILSSSGPLCMTWGSCKGKSILEYESQQPKSTGVGYTAGTKCQLLGRGLQNGDVEWTCPAEDLGRLYLWILPEEAVETIHWPVRS